MAASVATFRVGLIALLASVAVIAAPVSLSPIGKLQPSTAVAAQGHGNGSHGGNGNGSGSGAGSGHSVGSAAAGSDHSASAPTAPQATHDQLAAALGALNAAHASPQALAHASAISAVGRIAAYDRDMLAALAMPAQTPTQESSRLAAITAARTHLAHRTNKTLTPAVVQRVDQLLGLPATDPTLGATAQPH